VGKPESTLLVVGIREKTPHIQGISRIPPVGRGLYEVFNPEGESVEVERVEVERVEIHGFIPLKEVSVIVLSAPPTMRGNAHVRNLRSS